MGMRQKGSMDTGKHKDRQSAMMKSSSFFSLLVLFPPRAPSTSSCLPFKPHCTPLQSPASRLTPQLLRTFALWLPPPRALGGSYLHHLMENWGRDGFLWRWVEERSVWIETLNYDFQKTRCRLGLLSHLGRAKGRNRGHAFSCVPAETNPCRTFQHHGRTMMKLLWADICIVPANRPRGNITVI